MIKKLNMKKIVTITACTFCLTLGVGLTAFAEDADSKATTMAATTYVHVREGAGTHSTILGVLEPKEAIQVVGIDNGWYHVVYKDKPAYVFQEYLNFEGDEKGDIQNGHKTEMEATADVFVRADHKNGSYEMGVLKKGEKVNVVGKVDGWYEVDHNGALGYVYGHYLNFIGATTPAATEAKTDGKAVKGDKLVATGNVNLRTNNSMSARIIRVVPKGAEVSVLEYVDGWYRVDYDNDSGCISEKYLEKATTTAAPESEKGKELTTTTHVNMRTNNSMKARVIRVVPEGAKVTVLEKVGDWYRVDYDNDSGCIYGEYLK